MRLVTEVMTPVRFSSPADFGERRALVNERLLLSGFQVAEDGTLERVQAASTIAEAQRRTDDLRAALIRRNVHPDVMLAITKSAMS